MGKIYQPIFRAKKKTSKPLKISVLLQTCNGPEPALTISVPTLLFVSPLTDSVIQTRTGYEAPKGGYAPRALAGAPPHFRKHPLRGGQLLIRSNRTKGEGVLVLSGSGGAAAGRAGA